MSDNKQWRDFEQLIARIEEKLIPVGATIASPDRIPDKISGQLREVDASIRYTVGSVPILITIECRDRAGKQDVQWLEQIKAKRDSVGAHQTIVVAREGLTQPAMEYAKHHNIVVRRIEEVSDQFILACANSTQIYSTKLCFKDLKSSFGFYRLDIDAERNILNLSARVRKLIDNNEVFATDRNGEEVTLAGLFQECLDVAESRIRLELDTAKEMGADLCGEFEPDMIKVETEDGFRYLKRVVFSTIFFMEEKKMPPLTHVKYLDDEDGKIISFSETFDPESGLRVTVQFGWDGDGQILKPMGLPKGP